MISRIIEHIVKNAMNEYAWSYKIGEFVDYIRETNTVHVAAHKENVYEGSQKEWNRTLLFRFEETRGYLYKKTSVGSHRMFIMINPKILPIIKDVASDHDFKEIDYMSFSVTENGLEIINQIPHPQFPEYTMRHAYNIYFDEALPSDMIICSDFEYPEYAFKTGRYCAIHLEQLPKEFE